MGITKHNNHSFAPKDVTSFNEAGKRDQNIPTRKYRPRDLFSTV